MKKLTLLSLLVVFCAFWSNSVLAQPITGIAPKYPAVNGNAANGFSHSDYVERFSVDQPASVAGIKQFTITNDGSGAANEWGGAITQVYSGVTLIKAIDSLACSAPTNAAQISGNWALVYRGNCEFGAKALAVQQAGAQGCIIVNNVTGGPVGMGAGAVGAQVTIPVLMISKEEGDLINAELNASQVVKISITKWGLNKVNDAGFVPGGVALWNSYSIPLSQISGNTGNPPAFDIVTGAFVANFGSAALSNVKLKNTATYVSGTGTTTLFSDSVTIPSISVADSIRFGATGTNKPFTANSTGRLDLNYSISSAVADDYPADNNLTVSSYVHDSIYSKGRYDFEKGRPIVGINYQFNSGDFNYGPLYHMTKENYVMRKVQFTVSNGSATNPSLSGAGSMNVFVWKWADTNSNFIMDASELLPVGQATYNFGVDDSNGKIFTANIVDINTGKKVLTEANTTYWVAAYPPNGFFFGTDGYINYYPRNFFKFNQTPGDVEFYSPVYYGPLGDISDPNSGARVNGIAAEPYFRGDSARFPQQRNGLVAAIPLHLSKTQESSVPDVDFIFSSVALYPNPAKNQLTVSVDLKNNVSAMEYSVLDGFGRKISSEKLNGGKNYKFEVNTSALASGIYYLLLTDGNHTTMKKFVVSRD